MADNIRANQLSAKQITSNNVTVDGENILNYISRKISETQLDPVFKNWLHNESRLSDVGNNEIADYAKKSDVPTYLSDLNGTITKSKISDFGSYLSSSTVIPTAETFKDNFLSSSTVVPTKTSQLTNDAGFLTEHQSLADYALKTELPTAETFKDNFLSANADHTTSAQVNIIATDIAEKSKLLSTDITFKDPQDGFSTNDVCGAKLMLKNFVPHAMLEACDYVAITRIGIQPYYKKSTGEGQSIAANTFTVKLYDDDPTNPTLISAIASSGNTAAAAHEIPYVTFSTPIKVSTKLKYIRITFNNIDGTALTGINCGCYDTETTDYGIYKNNIIEVVSNTYKWNIIKSIDYLYDSLKYANSGINEINTLLADENNKVWKKTVYADNINLKSVKEVTAASFTALATDWTNGGLYKTLDGKTWTKAVLTSTGALSAEDFSTYKFPGILYANTRMMLITDTGMLYYTNKNTTADQILKPIEWHKAQLYRKSGEALSLDRNIFDNYNGTDATTYFVGGTNGATNFSISDSNVVTQSNLTNDLIYGKTVTGFAKVPDEAYFMTISSGSSAKILKGSSPTGWAAIPDGELALSAVKTWTWLNIYCNKTKGVYVMTGDGGDNQAVNRRTDIYCRTTSDKIWRRATVNGYVVGSTLLYCQHIGEIKDNGNIVAYVVIGRLKADPNTSYRLFTSKDGQTWNERATFQTNATQNLMSTANIHVNNESLLLVSTSEEVLAYKYDSTNDTLTQHSLDPILNCTEEIITTGLGKNTTISSSATTDAKVAAILEFLKKLGVNVI